MSSFKYYLVQIINYLFYCIYHLKEIMIDKKNMTYLKICKLTIDKFIRSQNKVITLVDFKVDNVYIFYLF